MGHFFLRAFLLRGIFMRSREKCKMPCKRVSLSIGALLGNLEGVHFSGFLREKKSIFGFVEWTQSTLRF
jgi:hypothetical protein